jgi:hypothetical protein
LILRVIFGETDTLRRGWSPDRGAEPLGERHRRLPASTAVDACPQHQRGIPAPRQQIGEDLYPVRVGRESRTHLARDRDAIDRLLPIVHWQGQVDRARGWLHGRRIATHQSCGNILGAQGLVAPFHVRLGQFWRASVAEPRLKKGHRAGLLARRHDEGCLVVPGGGQIAQRIAGAGGAVQVDDGWSACYLRIAIRHRER